MGSKPFARALQTQLGGKAARAQAAEPTGGGGGAGQQRQQPPPAATRTPSSHREGVESDIGELFRAEQAIGPHGLDLVAPVDVEKNFGKPT